MKREDIPTAVEIRKQMDILEEFSRFSCPDNHKKISHITINPKNNDEHVVGYYCELEKAGIKEKEFEEFFKAIEDAYLSFIGKRMIELDIALDNL